MGKLVVSPGQGIVAAHVNTLSDQSVTPYTSPLERDQDEPSPAEGQLCWVASLDELQVYRNGAWHNVSAADKTFWAAPADAGTQPLQNLGAGSLDTDAPNKLQVAQRGYQLGGVALQTPDTWTQLNQSVDQVLAGQTAVLPDLNAYSFGVPIQILMVGQVKYRRISQIDPDGQPTLACKLIYNSSPPIEVYGRMEFSPPHLALAVNEEWHMSAHLGWAFTVTESENIEVQLVGGSNPINTQDMEFINGSISWQITAG